MTSNHAVANPSYRPIPHPDKPFETFESFYPFYLGEHSKRPNRVLHLTGTSIALAINLRILLSLIPLLLQYLPSSSPASPSRNELARMLVVRLSLRLKDTLRLYILGVIQGYAFAWAGHFWVEKNKPATFKYPGFSLRGDHRMLWEVLTLQRSV